MLSDYEIEILEKMVQEEQYKNNIPLCTPFIKDFLEAYKELKDRATPMKPILYDLYDDGDNDFVFDANGNLENSYACCPNCKKQDIYDFEYGVCFKHCTNCGQKLDWRKE